jgi:hypothetical protein
MTVDFTKIGIQSEQVRTTNARREAARSEVETIARMGGWEIITKRLTGELSMGAGAPSPALQKYIDKSWKLLQVLNNGFAGIIFLLVGALCLYSSMSAKTDWRILGLGLGAMALAILFFKGCTEAANRLRSTTKASNSISSDRSTAHELRG